MPPLCSFCESFAAVVTSTERVGDGAVLDQTFYCEGHARSEGVRGAHAAALLVAVEDVLGHGVTR